MKIAEAAHLVGVEPHVLRHWEDVGVIAPERSTSGHRDYDANTVDHARIVRIAQRVGFTLHEIRELGEADLEGRRKGLVARRRAIREQIGLLESADRFLEHLAGCTHPVVSECPGCSDFLNASFMRLAS